MVNSVRFSKHKVTHCQYLTEAHSEEWDELRERSHSEAAALDS